MLLPYKIRRSLLSILPNEFPGGCCKCTDARHIKADRENKNPRKLDVFGENCSL